MDANAPRILDDVTVVIPTVGRDLLQGCLQSIARGTVWPAHLVVVDQGSNGAVVEWLDGLSRLGMSAERVRSSEEGAAAARNRGFEHVRTRLVAATDDDCRVHSRWLERLAARLSAHPDAMVTGRVAPVRGDTADGWAPSLIEHAAPVVHRRPLLRRDPLFANNMGFALRTVERIGAMDEHPTVRYAEDAEWSYRALRAGVPIVYAPEVEVEHVAWRSDAELFEVYRRYARSQGGFYGHHLRGGDAFVALRAAYDFLRGPWCVLRGVVTGNAELAAMGRAYATQLLPGALAGWRRRAS